MVLSAHRGGGLPVLLGLVGSVVMRLQKRCDGLSERITQQVGLTTSAGILVLEGNVHLRAVGVLSVVTDRDVELRHLRDAQIA